jgi:hypothetical protein
MIPPPLFRLGEPMVCQKRINPTTLQGGKLDNVVGLKEVVG